LTGKSTTAPNTTRKRVGLLLVHGIGEPKPKEFLDQFRKGFESLYGSDRVQTNDHSDPVDSERYIHGFEMAFDEETLFIYEVHWADLIDDELARGSFDPIHLLPLAWFPWFNKLAGRPGFDSYGKGRVTWWTIRLVPMSVLFFIGYVGLKAIPHIWWAWDSVISAIDRWHQVSPRRGTAALARRSAASAWNRKRPIKKIQTPSLDLMRLEQRGWFDILLDNYAGDVSNCVISMAHLPRLREDIMVAEKALRNLIEHSKDTVTIAKFRQRLNVEIQRRDKLKCLEEKLLSRFNRTAWIAVEKDRCSELQVLGHSLGSVIAYHAMNQNGTIATIETANLQCKPAAAVLTHFHTVGSPLEKVHFFWPKLVAPRDKYPTIFARGDGISMRVKADAGFKWDNYYSVSDMVSGALRHYSAWGGVTNRHIPGLGGVFTAHVAYRGNRNFLRILAKSLGAEVKRTSETLKNRALSWLWSTIQAAAFPLAVMAVCMIGIFVLVSIAALTAAMLTGLIWFLVYLISPLQLDWLANWSLKRTFYWITGFFGISMVIGFIAFLPAWGKRVARVAVARWWK
jgi:hypothetical protein